MNLYIDVGNTATKFGVEYNDEVEIICTMSTKEVINCPEDALSAIPGKLSHVYISSVVPEANKSLEKIFDVPVSFISPLDDSGIKINIDYPEELGTDLLCDIAAANKLFGYPNLSIDLGTATKFILIDEKGVFSTCAIVPGIELSLATLSNNTALLPRIDLKEIKPLLECHNTVDVLMSSVYYSHIDMINGLVKRYKEALGYNIQVIVTGGNLDFIKNMFDFNYKIKYSLCLQGIKAIADKKGVK